MMNKEYGLPKLLRTIPTESLDTALNILENKDLPLIHYIGATALLAYTPNEKHPEIKKRLKNILSRKYMVSIYENLENLESVFTDISFVDNDAIENLLTNSLSNDLIDKVAGRYLIVPNKNEKGTFYGLSYLFGYLLELDLKNFEQWLINTKRLDLKIVFSDLILSDSPSTYLSVSVDNLENSQIGLLQAFYALRKYNLDSHSRVYCAEEDINNLLFSKLSSRCKFIIYLKYIIHKYHGKKKEDLNGDTDFDILLDNLLNIGYDFIIDELFAQSPSYYSLVYMNIVARVKDAAKKKEFAKHLFSKLLKSFDDQDTPYNKI